MKKYFYLVATPESLIVSHLAPVDFGNYLAVGTKKQIRGQAIFFEINPDKTSIHQDYVNVKMKPYEDDEPKRSVFLSIYRVFEKTPLEALRSLYLVTDDGRVLELQAHDYIGNNHDPIHLYQQLAPITTRVASKLGPVDFIRLLTDLVITSYSIHYTKLYDVIISRNIVSRFRIKRQLQPSFSLL